MSTYWVIGGAYASARAERSAGGGACERYGPFESYADAARAWRERAREHMDDCNVRYHIVEDRQPDQAVPRHGRRLP